MNLHFDFHQARFFQLEVIVHSYFNREIISSVTFDNIITTELSKALCNNVLPLTGSMTPRHRVIILRKIVKAQTVCGQPQVETAHFLENRLVQHKIRVGACNSFEALIIELGAKNWNRTIELHNIKIEFDGWGYIGMSLD